MPQLTITPADVVGDATQEIYSKNGTATLKLGDDNAGTLTFNNILKSENGNASFYGSGEKKYMEYNSTDDKIRFLKDTDVNGDIICNGNFQLGTISDVEQKIIDISNNSVSNNSGSIPFISYDSVNDKMVVEKDMDLSINNLTFNKGVIQEVIGTTPSATGGSLTLKHDDIGGTSSIVFKSTKYQTDFGYISYRDDILGDSVLERSLLEIGVQNDGPSIYVDNIALMPSGNVGINTRTPQAMLDVSGDIICNGMIMNNVLISERFYHPTDDNGISIRTLNNPQLSGSIFDVRASGRKASLYCGFHITSSGANPFYFGFMESNTNKGNEGNTEYYYGKLGRDGSVHCTVKIETSDDRLKHNEIDISNGLNVIRQLKPQVYQKTNTMKEENYNGPLNEEYIIEAGFIAQDILKINDISYSVSVGDPSGNTPYSLNYNNIFIYGISAIQEVDKQLQEEKEKTITLQKQYDDLLSRIVSLENK